MSDAPNTVYLRLEGPLQAWGDNSKLIVRRTMDAPTKSGVLVLVCCAMGLTWSQARKLLPDLKGLALGVRVDRPGLRWWDYHTVGAGIGIRTAGGKVKVTSKTGDIETLVSRREYLSDASFLAALHGGSDLIEELADALASPRWPVFLGRKSCPPARPVLEGTATCPTLRDALEAVAWEPRHQGEARGVGKRRSLPCLLEWRGSRSEPVAPPEAEVWYDRPVSFEPPVHEPRLVLRDSVEAAVGQALLTPAKAPPRPRADYGNERYKQQRLKRIAADEGLCVLCKSPATTVQHVTYRRAGGDEDLADLRALCRLCHDAVTMVEYGLNMGLDRINPEDPRWRERVLAKRREIVDFRSLESRRRSLRAGRTRVGAEVAEEED